MKKRIWIFVSIIILLLLVIPVPTGVYKDGGTREYTALTYKIVDWHRMYGDKIYEEVKVYPFPMNFMSIDRLFYREKLKFNLTDFDIDGDNELGLVEKHEVKDCPFEARYVRTNGTDDNVKYPRITLIRSVKELKDYYEYNKTTYHLEDKFYPESENNASSDSSIDFVTACEKYDEVYFENNILILALLEEGSGSIRHDVKKISFVSEDDEQYLKIDIDRKIPEAYTDDMAEWHIFIETSKEYDVISENNVRLYIDGVYKTGNTRTVEYTENYANISFELPHNWSHKVLDSESDVDINIAVFHDSDPDQKIVLSYQSMFGFCGTDLKQKDITLNGHSAREAVYGKKTMWDFIYYTNTPGAYVIFNHFSEEAFEKHEHEIKVLLSSFSVAKGIIGEKEAMLIAKKSIDFRYENYRAEFDSKTGFWCFSFYEEDYDDLKDIVYVRYDGALDRPVTLETVR